MRFERVRIDAYGGLGALDTGEDELPGLVVVHGPNEAGKSTFFGFLSSLLYGFYPASRDRHPHAPWSGGTAGGNALLRLDRSGELWEVERRLLSSPTGSLVRNGRKEDLRNRTLPCVEHVPRAVFGQVFALTLGELGALEGESWSRVQDRLVAGMGTSDLLPAREAVRDLERDAGRLWRPNHRGNQEIRNLRQRLRELRERRAAASEKDRKLREADRELHDLRATLRNAREEREECLLYIERYRALLPIRDQLRRIEGLEEEAGDPAELEGLPPDAPSRLEELDDTTARLRDHLAELEGERADLATRKEAFGEPERRILDAGDTVRSLVGRTGSLEPVQVRRGQVDQELRDLERRVLALGGELIEGGADALPEAALDSLRPTRIRSAVEELHRAVETRKAAEAALPAGPADPAGSAGSAGPTGRGWIGRAVAPGLGAVGLGVALVVASGSVTSLPGLAGAALVLAGAVWIGAGVGANRRGRVAAGVLERREREARAREAAAREQLRDVLGEIPLDPRLVEHPVPDLAGRLERLQELLRDRADRREELGSLEERAEEVRQDVLALGGRLEREVPADPAAAAHVLDAALRDAERARDAAREVTRQMGRLDREIARARTELTAVEEEAGTLRSRLRALGGGDEARGVQAARLRLRAADRARQLQDELERSHHDLPEIRGRIADAERAGEDWVVDESALARKKALEKELASRIEELVRRTEGLEKDVAYLRKEDTVDAIEGEIATVEERLEEATLERDRLTVLAEVIRQADRRFREEHQPDVLRRAGEHLESITRGRYGRILVGDSEDSSDPGSFFLQGPDYPGPVAVGEPISTGTREQTYLALRLAILDHLDRGGERLPVFLDEAFVNWDDRRRGRIFDLLDELSSERQLFVFTCHEAMAGELEGRGARRISLPGPGDARDDT